MGPRSPSALGSSRGHTSPSSSRRCLPLHLNLSHILPWPGDPNTPHPSLALRGHPALSHLWAALLWYLPRLLHRALSFTPASTQPRYHLHGKPSLTKSHRVCASVIMRNSIPWAPMIWHTVLSTLHGSSQCDGNSEAPSLILPFHQWRNWITVTCSLTAEQKLLEVRYSPRSLLAGPAPSPSTVLTITANIYWAWTAHFP